MTDGGGAAPPHAGAWWREGAVVAVAFGLCLLGGVLQVDDTAAPPPLAAYVIAAVSSAALLARHRAPVVTMVLTTVCGMLAAPAGLLLTPLVVAPAVVAAHTLGSRTEARALVVLPAASLLVVLAPFTESQFSWEDASRLVTVAAAPLVAVVLGRSARHRRAYLAFVEERALRAEEARDSEARTRVAEERVRIARELHDLVAHQITLANAQASVAARLLDTRPGQARESLEELVGTTRQALDHLRATVGLLRDRDETPAPTEPAPGLRGLEVLVESFRRAGLEVSVQHTGSARPLPPAVDLTAYRIVQEALTNVTKHSAAHSARVRLTWHHDRLEVTVTDDGPEARTPVDRSPGYGLVGLRERAVSVDGRLTVGPRPGGGFLVTAHLPLTATGSLVGGPTENARRESR
ncbi:sensor histidine kinase [Oceanitalea stevensii]|uniref:histidine kinase n=1 Tax=Oceanitalea stevensii TaxID=2763072 RepID=A0ABR8YY80_9MICO|nr:sensor histidine kinase [Oceanitalea stevensii]MBD8060996.1 sensor histidine kinase [Oceanitalea stevensii]